MTVVMGVWHGVAGSVIQGLTTPSARWAIAGTLSASEAVLRDRSWNHIHTKNQRQKEKSAIVPEDPKTEDPKTCIRAHLERYIPPYSRALPILETSLC